ncbi:MAG: pyruvate kinase [Ruminococcaceae bacterium]|nr:pyruvate kinase [Oscillospiraceae bacterium]
MRRTKIICTLGPASSNETALAEMLSSGMNVARLNFSHGTHEEHRRTIELFRKVRDKLKLPAAVLLDTKGPEIRLGKVKDGTLLRDGQPFIFTTADVEGDDHRVSISYKELPSQVKSGDQLLIDDGRIRLTVDESSDTEIHCIVKNGGPIKTHKGVNVPNVALDMPYISPADEADLLFGIEQDVDFIAASFVRSKEDVIAVRKFLDYNGGHSIKIIAKIENIQGVRNFDEILHYSDGIMVARGDMGVEIEYERLPGIQKRFIRKCYMAGKMVICATQMLESMIQSTTPTRAEITDIANAVFDGTSAVMLSGETAMGAHPSLVVKVMARIAEQAELDAMDMNAYSGIVHENDANDTTNAICDAACTTARDLRARAIIAVTKSGQTARRVSKFRPFQHIIAATPSEKTFHQLSLSWGVFPVLARSQDDTDSLFLHAIDCAKQIDLVTPGDTVVITAGVPLNTPGSTNLLKVQTVEGRA